MTRALTIGALAVAALALTACGSSKPETAVQKCTSAYQAYVSDGLNGDSAAGIRAHGSASDIRILDTAQKACDALTPAQARKAAAGLYP